MELKKAFGVELRKRREKAGKSQEELAFDAELDRTFISLLERGLRQPTLSTLFLLAKPLKIKASELVKSVENKVK